MADNNTATQESAKPALPDFYTNPDAVLHDKDVTWRHKRAPDYSKTRKYFDETKSKKHEAGSLPELVENLVKNWEIEASYKTEVSDWRTVNQKRYTFSMNGSGVPLPAEHMVKTGTYNAIITPNEYYSPNEIDFTVSHKLFKRMMPTFAWEVLEVYSGPPKVAFRWRHWGKFANDYVGINDKREKVAIKAHGDTISVEGVTVADLDENMKIVHLETWFDPMQMFHQMIRDGNVTKQAVDSGENASKTSTTEGVSNGNGQTAAAGGCPMGY